MKLNSLTPAKKAKFLAVLAETGNVSTAAKTAGISRCSLYDRRKREAAFAKAWDDSEKQAADVLEKEAWRRAVDGVDEPVYQKGECVGTVRRYSDTLLIFLMKGANPQKYADRRRIEGDPDNPVLATVTHKVVFVSPKNE